MNLARFGPYFAIDTEGAGQPLGTLAGEVLIAQVEGVRERLGSDFRVAASVFHLGLCARLVSPVIGAAVLGYRLDLTEARWSGPYPFRLSVPAIPAGPAGSIVAVAELTRQVAGLGVSTRVLWGNVASAVNGAAVVIGAVDPALRAAASEIAAASLPPLTCTGGIGAGFRRRSCCLIYRVSRQFCGDCILAARHRAC